jgi:hypothetical protein
MWIVALFWPAVFLALALTAVFLTWPTWLMICLWVAFGGASAYGAVMLVAMSVWR